MQYDYEVSLGNNVTLEFVPEDGEWPIVPAGNNVRLDFMPLDVPHNVTIGD